jgi:N-succinyldiaminopimelate aminotransferase
MLFGGPFRRVRTAAGRSARLRGSAAPSSGVVVFGSLSKRSNAPGLRSGYVAGDAKLVAAFLRYRTYHGSAMSPAVATASLAAWRDEAHVRENRARYAAKFDALTPRLAAALPCERPDAAFYLWAKTPGDDAEFAKRLYAEEHVTVLPGSYIARDAHGINPGRGRIRIALVAGEAECAEGVDRIVRLARRM